MIFAQGKTEFLLKPPYLEIKNTIYIRVICIQHPEVAKTIKQTLKNSFAKVIKVSHDSIVHEINFVLTIDSILIKKNHVKHADYYESYANLSIITVDTLINRKFTAYCDNIDLVSSSIIYRIRHLVPAIKKVEVNSFSIAEVINFEDTAVMRELLKKGQNINKYYRDESLLMYAAKRNKCIIVNYLIKTGATIHFKNKDGGTALHIAAIAGAFNAYQTLIQHGLSENIKDKYGKTPKFFYQVSKKNIERKKNSISK